MRYHKKFPDGTVETLENLIKTVKSEQSLRRIQAIYFRAKFHYPPSQIAAMTGFSVGSVRNLHVAFFDKGVQIFTLGRSGGRRAAYMTPEEEADFLRPFIKDGDAGSILEVSRIYKAHCDRVGKKISLSTTYDLLRRHGWRKIMPRSRHPKADKEAQAAFKKMARDS
jgi:transposase